jgi:hypothetical protein
MTVTSSLGTAATGELFGRPEARVLDDLYKVDGGPAGVLSNASFASAKQVAQIIVNEAWTTLLFLRRNSFIIHVLIH